MDDLSLKLGLREGYGVMIAEVIKDTPAAASGLMEGDLVVAIDGRPVVETRGLQRIVGGTAAGRELTLVVLRAGRRIPLGVRVGAMPGDIVAERVAAEFGFLVRPAPGPEGGAGAAPSPLIPGSPIVAAVGEGTAAARGGLAVGDRIVAVNGGAVESLAALRDRLQEVFLRDALRLRVERRTEPREVVLPPARPADALQ
jgi:serine protease Do